MQLMQNEYKLITLKELDREIKQEHEIDIICDDHGLPQKRAIVSVTVAVQDINDNRPRFSKHEYIYTIRENNHIDEHIGVINAIDPDYRENGTVSYYLCEDTAQEVKDMVRIIENTGAITARKRFDREEAHMFDLCAVATDHGPEPKSSTTKVVIHLLDEDDERPKFTQRVFEFSVEENKNSGSYVGKLVAYDKDSPPGNEFSFHFANYREHDVFDLDFKTGVLSTRKLLDREITDIYILNVTVVGKNNQLHTDNAIVKVKVTDVNDNRPIIIFPESRSNIQVSNRVPVGYNVTQIRATDADVGDNAIMTYRLLSGSHPFRIDIQNGAISVADDISSFNLKTVSIPVLVSDNGESPLNDTVGFTITINSSIPYVPSIAANMEERTIFGLNLKIFIIAIATSIIAIFFIAMFAVLCIAYTKSDRKKGKKYMLAEVNGETGSGEKDSKQVQNGGKINNGKENGHRADLPNGHTPDLMTASMVGLNRNIFELFFVFSMLYIHIFHRKQIHCNIY
jgi:protocadherin delta 1